MNDLQKSIAVLYKRKGKDVLSEREFVFSASMDMRWFSPKDAQKLMDAGLTDGFLEKKNGSLMPTFDWTSAEVPLDFKPSSEAIKLGAKRSQDLFSEIVESIVRTKSVPKREVVSKVNKKQELLGIDIEPAALLVASSYGLQVDKSHLDRAMSAVMSRDVSAE
ncbi:MAG: DUF2240 family protein [Candidatus Thermoplasmatota archaeon]|nr:DUF2240 family protein [Candidatus Thermoplasmatota archaeon]